MPMEVKEQVRRSVSITDVASLYMDLKPAGKHFKALCPFHTEKTPSFFVMPDKETFTCYGCNKFGDIFTLVQEMENVSFPQALNFLIDKFHVPVHKTREGQVDRKDVYAGINDLAMKYFRANLVDAAEGKQARAYLDKRGIGHGTVDAFSIGYAENKWDGLANHLKKKGVDIERAVELGLSIRGPNNRVYDRFRGRIIFPIFSETGTLLAFGGRTIFDEPNKYLNSPDTPLYKKGSHLFGFHLARKFIKEADRALLVEGYFDVVSLYQHGIKYVTASLGTALTENQIYLLKRFSANIYLSYDSDKAGVAAAVRGIEKMFEQNVNPRIMLLKDAKDPDELIQKSGMKGLNEEIGQAVEGFKFLLDRIDSDFPDWRRVPEKKKLAMDRIRANLEKIADPIIQDGYQGLAADFFKAGIAEFKAANRPLPSPEHGDRQMVITPVERIFLEAILAVPAAIPRARSMFPDVQLAGLSAGNLIRLIFQHYVPAADDVDFQKIMQKLGKAEQVEFQSVYEAREKVRQDVEALPGKIENSFVGLNQIINQQKMKQLNQDIKIAERENNMQKVQELSRLKDRFVKQKFSRMQEA